MAAKVAVATVEERAPMEQRKRKAEEAPACLESPLKIARIVRSELEQGANAAEKKMTRLPREEVASILATVMDDDRLPLEYRALKSYSPDLTPFPDEEMDEELVSFYELVRDWYAAGEEFREFQAWVRSEYAENGYVEVDDEFMANRAQGEAIVEEARKEAIKGFDFSGLMD